MSTATIIVGDCLEELKKLPDKSVHCCVTSPPYFGLRSYGIGTENGEIGLEPSLTEYVEKLVGVFREVRRALRDDGTLWLNLGDSYANDGKWGGQTGGKHVKALHGSPIGRNKRYTGLKPKDLIGIPWAVAFAMRSDGWYLRSDIIWAKPNCMPESVTDRPTRSHEYLFLLSKLERYHYDYEAIKEPASESFLNDPRHKTGSTPRNEKNGYEEHGAQNPKGPHRMFDKQRGHSRRHDGFNDRWDQMEKIEQCNGMRNKRDVWTVAPANFTEAHFATYPPDLIKPCILSGCPVGGTVLDPFAGSGTTGMVAVELGRCALLIELNPDYAKLCEQRCNITPGLPLAV